MNTTHNNKGRPILVDPAFIQERQQDPRLVILDASMAVVGAAEGAAEEKIVIPGARRFDIDSEFSDGDAPFPHTLLASEVFSARARRLGICSNSMIVVYDHMGVYSAPRAWWMFKAMGHDEVFLLNGGLPAWRAAGFSLVSDYAKVSEPGNFSALPRKQYFCKREQLIQAQKNKAIVIDARSADRFHGRVDEPRAGVRRGNIPESLNVPFQALLDGAYYRPTEQLQQHFDDLKLSREQHLIFSCGSGITACIDAVAASMCGYANVGVYDGSWCEWAATTAD